MDSRSESYMKQKLPEVKSSSRSNFGQLASLHGSEMFIDTSIVKNLAPSGATCMVLRRKTLRSYGALVSREGSQAINIPPRTGRSSQRESRCSSNLNSRNFIWYALTLLFALG